MRTGFCTCLLISAALAQVPTSGFDPFPNGLAARYHFDLRRNFFRSPEAESAARGRLTSALDDFKYLAAASTRSGPQLLRALRAQDSLLLEVTRHRAYLELRYYSDTRVTESRGAADALGSRAAGVFTGFDSVLASLPESLIVRFERVAPALVRYRFSIETARRSSMRRLSPEGERALAALGPLASGGGAEIFATTLNGTDFGYVQTPSGSLSVARDYPAIATNPDARVRREGYLRNVEGLARNREVYADILVRTAEALNAAARLRGYRDYVEESYSDRFLNRALVVSFLDSLAAYGATNKRIEQAIIERRRTTFGVDSVHPWDLTVPEPGVTTPRFTITEATRLVLEATRPLGETYTRELAALLDPANGRLDIAPGRNRANRQGFSTGLVGFPSMFYQGAFRGYVEDLVTLAHESGHAVQNMLMTRGHVLPRYATGPAYFTESFAGLSELLILEHLYRQAADRAHKILYLERLINQGAECFRSGWESLVEQQLFDSVSAGRRLRADDIEAVTQATASRFSVWFGPGSARRLAWLQPTQFFTRPLYRVSYVYAKVLALRYFALLQHDPAFRARYIALLDHGYDAPPDALLAGLVDIKLSDPALVRDAVPVLETWLRELEILYRDQSTQPDWRRLEQRIPSLLDSAAIPGLAIASVAGGKIAWAKGFGVRRADAPGSIDTTTVFEAASLGKPVVAYAAMQLMDQGRRDLDRPLSDFAQNAALAADPRATRITARMVLSHTSGLPNEVRPGERPEIRFDPGTHFAYSGEGFRYLQLAIEALVGERLDVYLRRAVFEPLQMARSSFIWEDRFESNAAIGHDDYGTPRRPTHPVVARAPSSLHTTVADYARFVLAMLAARGLTERSRRAMLTAQVQVAPGVAWGLGWALQKTATRTLFWHWGDNSNSGYTAFVQADPVAGSGFVYLTNSTGGLSLVGVLDQEVSGEVLPAVAFMHYESFDAPLRVARLELERRIRVLDLAAGLRYLDSLQSAAGEKLPEPLLNSLGYRFLALGRTADAIALFKRNVEAYPRSANVYDSLGEAYAVAGDTAAAIANYRRSLQLDARNQNAAEMLTRLGAPP